MPRPSAPPRPKLIGGAADSPASGPRATGVPVPWKSMFFSSPDIAAVLDVSGTIMVVNQAWSDVTRGGGKPVSSGVGTNYLQVCRRAARAGDEIAGSVHAGLTEVLGGSTTRFRVDYPCETPTEHKWFRMEATAITPLSGADRLVAVRHLDVSEWVNAREDLRTQAMTDPLTALPNRRALAAHIQAVLAATGPLLPTMLLIVDIDHFKSINDIHGHLFGDACLVRVAQLLRENSRHHDMASRWGGDEFVLLVQAGSELGLAAAEARITQVSRTHHDGIEIGLSWGRARAVAGDSYQSLVARADRELRVAKDRRQALPPGRNGAGDR